MAAATPKGLRKGRRSDLDALLELEAACFQPYRRASRRSLARSLASPRQSVHVIERAGLGASKATGASARDAAPGFPGGIAAVLVLWHFPHLVRVYDIATHPAARHEGLGRALMAFAESAARKAGATWMSLEAEAADKRLVAWYQAQGYDVVAKLPGFYSGGQAAVRMRKRL